MKFLFLSLLFSISLSSLASEKSLLCSYHQAKKLKTFLGPKNITDKSKHCLISCVMSKRCSKLGSWGIGVLKEIQDLFGKGNAEWADLKANRVGIYLSSKVTHERGCLIPCLELFDSSLEDYYQ